MVLSYIGVYWRLENEYIDVDCVRSIIILWRNSEKMLLGSDKFPISAIITFPFLAILKTLYMTKMSQESDRIGE